MPKETPGYVTDQGFPNVLRDGGENPLPPPSHLVEEEWEILLGGDIFNKWWVSEEE